MKKRMFLTIAVVFLWVQISFGQTTVESGTYAGFRIAGTTVPEIQVWSYASTTNPLYRLAIDGSLLSEYVMATLVNIPPSGYGVVYIDKITVGTGDEAIVKYRFSYPDPDDGHSGDFRGIGFYYNDVHTLTIEVLQDNSHMDDPYLFTFDVNEPAQRLKLDYMVAALVKQYGKKIVVNAGTDIKFLRE